MCRVDDGAFNELTLAQRILESCGKKTLNIGRINYMYTDQTNNICEPSSRLF